MAPRAHFFFSFSAQGEECFGKWHCRLRSVARGLKRREVYDCFSINLLSRKHKENPFLRFYVIEMSFECWGPSGCRKYLLVQNAHWCTSSSQTGPKVASVCGGQNCACGSFSQYQFSIIDNWTLLCPVHVSRKSL